MNDNLPPGVRLSDIPGNRPDDLLADHLADEACPHYCEHGERIEEPCEVQWDLHSAQAEEAGRGLNDPCVTQECGHLLPCAPGSQADCTTCWDAAQEQASEARFAHHEDAP